ncbi:LCP family protein required for cell wall assembly [Mycetocola sp. BIGb0189]|uniref:LCP family protein n=1 Tax=Mycetocola sp. BIGb0189 TaxID=2940604 RepID=UPI00216774A8|nr:LCP family protein [Mycetocola sp. BIGb0189]MCS4275381.1 LCP family protein required for cell wall assembly [Mycetocola sp. BIGb0189]
MTDPNSSRAAVSHAAGLTPRKRLRRQIALAVVSTLVLLTAGTGAFALYVYQDLNNNIHRSPISMPSGKPEFGANQNTDETNILIMGLDSRVDQNGKPFPEEIYNAIHAGDQGDGGYNANVMMLIHIPAGGGRAQGISIPRDDYAELAGHPNGVKMSKIKEAYGLALDEKLRELVRGGMSRDEAYQEARTAGRQAQINTVSNFLGGVRIDHFVEITMAAFYQVAQAVAPIQVCLNQATEDKYSGANFPAGMQEIDAQQAMSFVRQRRDTGKSGLELTDFDRTRRQQAFMVSLAYKLKQAGTFTNPATITSLVGTAKQYIAVDDGFEFLSFAQQASSLAGGNITFTTLPITGYAKRDGKDVNLVDLDQIHATVAQLLGTTPSGSATPETPATGGAGAGTAETPKTPETPQAPASEAPATPGAPSSEAPADNTYHDWKEPLQAGSIPCVN